MQEVVWAVLGLKTAGWNEAEGVSNDLEWERSMRPVVRRTEELMRLGYKVYWMGDLNVDVINKPQERRAVDLRNWLNALGMDVLLDVDGKANEEVLVSMGNGMGRSRRWATQKVGLWTIDWFVGPKYERKAQVIHNGVHCREVLPPCRHEGCETIADSDHYMTTLEMQDLQVRRKAQADLNELPKGYESKDFWEGVVGATEELAARLEGIAAEIALQWADGHTCWGDRKAVVEAMGWLAQILPVLGALGVAGDEVRRPGVKRLGVRREAIQAKPFQKRGGMTVQKALRREEPKPPPSMKREENAPLMSPSGTLQAWEVRIREQSLRAEEVASAEHKKIEGWVEMAARRFRRQAAHRPGAEEVGLEELAECLGTMSKSGALPVDAVKRDYFKDRRVWGFLRWMITLMLRGAHTPRGLEKVAVDFHYKDGDAAVMVNWRIVMVSTQWRVLLGKVLLRRHGEDVRSANHSLQHGYLRSPIEHLYSHDAVVKLRWQEGLDTAVLCGD